MKAAAGGKEHINEVIRHIESDLASDWDTESLSRLGYTSRTQLYRDFYSVTGHSVKEYVRKRRLSTALALIKASEFSLSEIAYECGYSSQQMLCRTVKRAVRMTPMEYRDSDVCYFFPPFSENAGNQITVTNETIPGTLCISYCQSSLKGIENNAVGHLLSLMPEYRGRLFGRNGRQDGTSFYYELYLTEADDMAESLNSSRFSISHKREPFTATFASTTVKNAEDAINSAWDYLYTDWLCHSMFEYADESYFEEYIVKNGDIAKLRLILPIRRRNGYMKIKLEQAPPMPFLVSEAKGPNAERISSETVMRFLSQRYPYIAKTAKVFYMQKNAHSCVCGVQIISELRISQGENTRNLRLPEGLYAVLHSGVAGDYSHYRELLLSWVRGNGMIPDIPRLFAVYDVEDGYDNPDMKLYCPVKMGRNDNTGGLRHSRLRLSKH